MTSDMTPFTQTGEPRAAAAAEAGWLELAQDVVRRAVRGGASAAECVIQEGEAFSVRVRLGEIERLKDSGSKAIGLRVLRGKRAASSYSSDFSREGIQTLVESALDAARFTSEDPYVDLPDPSELGFGAQPEELNLYRDDVLSLSPEERIDLARRCEQAALDSDPRITNSDGAGFAAGWGRLALANSLGFAGTYRSGSCSLSATPVAESGGSRERDSWYTLGRAPAELDAPEEVGRTAARRALRRLDARRVPTTEAPVVFEPPVAKSLLQTLFSAVSGSAVYRKASFLAGRLGERVDAEIARPHARAARQPAGRVARRLETELAGGFGSSPFDDEGVASRRTTAGGIGV